MELLYSLFWDQGKIVEENLVSLQKTRERVVNQLKKLRVDHTRLLNPTPYKVQ